VAVFGFLIGQAGREKVVFLVYRFGSVVIVEKLIFAHKGETFEEEIIQFYRRAVGVKVIVRILVYRVRIAQLNIRQLLKIGRRTQTVILGKAFGIDGIFGTIDWINLDIVEFTPIEISTKIGLVEFQE
jgi:hypothetical protein